MTSPPTDQLERQLHQSTDRAGAVQAKLTTDERVIARVTDGIYRQPGSALRELVSNAYDADATAVTIRTDAPRFSRIVVEDNGNGMSPDAALHILRHIGGSPKRTDAGAKFNVTAPEDVTKSPGGRDLIGKLGIGLFSVSQLTHSFQIVTKTANDDFQTVILVNLRQFADEVKSESETEYEAGEYQIWKERATDKTTHGTTIFLTAIRPQTRDTLRSEQLWNAIDSPNSDSLSMESTTEPPRYYIGRLEADSEQLVDDQRRDIRRLPWDESDSPDTAFTKMVDGVWSYVKTNAQNPSLSYIFDNYLQMIWNLSLSLPLPYVEKNVMDEEISDGWAYFYKLSNKSKGIALEIPVPSKPLTLRELCGLRLGKDGDDFQVTMDGVRLRRPVRFRNLPVTNHALKKPMVFVGAFSDSFDGIPVGVSAGPLSFEAYLFWTPKIAPTEHAGVLVRIHGSSGTLFDSTFLNYQVSEQTRLKQITCEIFLHEGLEAALNIDRESFNTSHPHTIMLTRWLHSALRQLATAQKREAQTVRLSAKKQSKQASERKMYEIVEHINQSRTEGEGVIPDVQFRSEASNSSDVQHMSNIGIVLDLDTAITELPIELNVDSNRQTAQRLRNLRSLEAITKILAIYGALDHLAKAEQEQLMASILGVLEVATDG